MLAAREAKFAEAHAQKANHFSPPPRKEREKRNFGSLLEQACFPSSGL